MARKDGIACDFCNKTLGVLPESSKTGWDYVWSTLEIGTAEFYYATCSECCSVDHSLLDKIDACLKRAGRHSKSWRNASERFIAKTQWRMRSMADVHAMKARIEAVDAELAARKSANASEAHAQ